MPHLELKMIVEKLMLREVALMYNTNIYWHGAPPIAYQYYLYAQHNTNHHYSVGYIPKNNYSPI